MDEHLFALIDSLNAITADVHELADRISAMVNENDENAWQAFVDEHPELGSG